MAAGVDPALVIHRFGSKEALWRAVIEQQALYLAPLITELKKLRGQTEVPIRARIETAFRRMIAATFGGSGMRDVPLPYQCRARREARPSGRKTPSSLSYDAFHPLLVEAAKAGVIKNQRLEMFYFMLIHAVTMTVSYRHVLEYFDDISQDVDRLKEDMTQFLIVNFLEGSQTSASKKGAWSNERIPTSISELAVHVSKAAKLERKG